MKAYSLSLKKRILSQVDRTPIKPPFSPRASCYIKGQFVKEGETRFVAFVKVSGNEMKCYVPTSTKLSYYIGLVEGAPVLLRVHNGKFFLDFVKVGSTWVGVNSSLASSFLAKRFTSEGKNVQREQWIDQYRFDLVVAGVYYEVKSIITDAKTLLFPNAKSERRLSQLRKIRRMLKQNVPVELSFVGLSSTLRTFRINKRSATGKLLHEAIKEGLRISCWRLIRRSSLVNVPVELVSKKDVNENW